MRNLISQDGCATQHVKLRQSHLQKVAVLQAQRLANAHNCALYLAEVGEFVTALGLLSDSTSRMLNGDIGQETCLLPLQLAGGL